jgi:hypothetical protein
VNVRARLADWWSERIAREDGTAIIEFIFVAVLVFVPLVYLIVSVAVIQRGSLAVSSAAREAGRAFATSDSAAQAQSRAQIAARLALTDQGDDAAIDLRYVADGDSCDAAPVIPQLIPGAVFLICVQRSFALPGVPPVLAGRGVTVVGKYVVHIDDYRASR